jgi:hypothetical protein
MELLRVGLTPERAIYAVQTVWTDLRAALFETVVCLAGEADHMHYTFIEVDALSKLTDPDADHLHVYCRHAIDKHFNMASLLDEEKIPETERDAFHAMKHETLDKYARSIILETDSLVLRLWAAMEDLDISPALLRDDLLEWKRAIESKRAEEAEAPRLPLAETPSAEEPAPFRRNPFDISREALGYGSVDEVWADAQPEARHHATAEHSRKES